MSARYLQVSERVLSEGKLAFSCSFPVRDDYGVSDWKWEVYQLGEEWWLLGTTGNETNAFARFAGTPDLVRARERAPDRNRVVDLGFALTPNPAAWQEDSRSAQELFGCGLDETTYEHNAF